MTLQSLNSSDNFNFLADILFVWHPLGLFAEKQQESIKKANEHKAWWTKPHF